MIGLSRGGALKFFASQPSQSPPASPSRRNRLPFPESLSAARSGGCRIRATGAGGVVTIERNIDAADFVF
jgi:hypothetical protein